MNTSMFIKEELICRVGVGVGPMQGPSVCAEQPEGCSGSKGSRRLERKREHAPCASSPSLNTLH